jgi:hypothetical protein
MARAAEASRARPQGRGLTPKPPSYYLRSRITYALPASVEANWVFRLALCSTEAEFAATTRAVVARVVLLPLALLLGVAYLALLGPWTATRLLLLALLVAALASELAFLRFPKIPFCCRYVPGRSRPFARWPLYLLMLVLFWVLLPAAAAWLLRRNASYWFAAAALAGAELALAGYRDRKARGEPLRFDEEPPPLVISLGLLSR